MRLAFHKHKLSICLLLLFVSIGYAQNVSLPSETKGEVGAFIKVPASTNGKEVRWYSPDKGLQVFPVELLKDSKTAIVTANVPGRYRLVAWTAVGDIPSDPAICVIIVGDAPTPGPGPGPNPDPIPPTPSPSVTDGKRCILIYESAELSKLPEKQRQILTAKVVRDYLRAKCDKEPDGKTPSCGFFDKDDALDGYSPKLSSLMKRERKQVPWVIVGNSKTSYEGPLPASLDEFMTLLKKYLD